MYLNLSVEQLFYIKKDLERFEEFNYEQVEHFIGCYELDPKTVSFHVKLEELNLMLEKADYILSHPLAINNILNNANTIRLIVIEAIKYSENHKIYKENLKHKRKEFQKIRNLLYKDLLILFEECCKICHSKNNLEIDHIIPLSKEGTNDLSNLQFLCSSCNSRKGNRC